MRAASGSTSSISAVDVLVGTVELGRQRRARRATSGRRRQREPPRAERARCRGRARSRYFPSNVVVPCASIQSRWRTTASTRAAPPAARVARIGRQDPAAGGDGAPRSDAPAARSANSCDPVADERRMRVAVDETRDGAEPASVDLLDVAGERREVAHGPTASIQSVAGRRETRSRSPRRRGARLGGVARARPPAWRAARGRGRAAGSRRGRLPAVSRRDTAAGRARPAAQPQPPRRSRHRRGA